MKQVFSTKSNVVNNTGVQYNGAFHGGPADAPWAAADTNRKCIIPTAGTFRNLYIELKGTPGAGTSYIFTVYKNGVATALTVTIADAATSGSDVANSFTVAAGDYITLHKTVSGTPTARTPQWSIEFEGDNAKESIYCAYSDDVVLNTANEWNGIIGHGTIWRAAGTNFAVQSLVPLNGTIKSLYVLLNGTPGSGNNYAVSVYKNGATEATSTVTIADAATSGNVTGLTIDIAPGDTLSIIELPASTPTARAITTSILVEADVDGESMMTESNSDVPANAATEFQSFSTGGDAWDATEANKTLVSGITSWVAKSLYYSLETAPGTGNSWNFTLRKNAANTEVTVNIAHPALTGNDTTHTDTIALGDDYAMQSVPASGPTVSKMQFGLVQFITVSTDLSISVNEATTVTEVVTGNILLKPLVVDEVTTEEVINVTQAYNVSVNDATALTEVVAVSITEDTPPDGDIDISVNDATTVSEVITRNLPITISVEDSTTVSEVTSVLTFVDYFTDVFDTTTLTEVITSSIVVPPVPPTYPKIIIVDGKVAIQLSGIYYMTL